MKAIMRSLITILALAGTSAFAIAAPEATAMWDKNLANSSTVNGYTMGLGTGTSATDGIVTIGSETSGGITINKSSNHATDFTMIFKVANLPATSSGEMFLVSARSTSKVNDPVGIYFDGLTPKRIKGGDRSADSSATANAIVEGTGERTFAFIHNKQTNKLYLYEIVGEEAQLKYEGSTGFGNDNPNTSGVNIGAPKAASSSGAIPACANMTVSGVALFETVLTADEIGAFKFPSDDSDKFLEPDGTEDENGVAPYYWYQFNGNTTKASCATTDIPDMNTLGSVYVADRGGQEGKAIKVSAGIAKNVQSDPGRTCVATTNPNGSDPFTVSCTAKVTPIANNKALLWCFGSNNDNMLLVADTENKQIEVIQNNSTIKYEIGVEDLTEAFHTYVLVGRGSSTVDFYVDGAKQTAVHGWYPNATKTAFGLASFGLAGGSVFSVSGIQGAIGSYIDDFRVYRGVALTDEQVAKIGANMNQKEPEVTPTATISSNTAWGDLEWDPSVPTANDKAELTVSANAKLTIDDDTAFKSLKLIGARNLTIAGITSSNVALLPKISIGSFTGKLTFEINASAGFTADDTLRNFIRTASDKLTFVFKGSGNKGAALGYGFTVNAAIHSHIVFDGGTHTMSYGYGGSGADGNCFGVNADGNNPTVLVTGNATLNFTAKDISYWSGASDIGGVIRVNDGATLNLLQNGQDTFFYRQRLWLDPGSLTTFNYTAKNQGAGSESCFRFHGGAVQNKEQIYVPASVNDMTSKPAVIKQLGAGALHLASDNTVGLAIFVGANSKLRLETPITTGGNNPPLIKYGTGVLETVKSITTSSFTMTEGTFASNSTVNKLSIGMDVALDISNGAPTITDTFTAQSKVLKLVIDNPTHMMEVITLPEAADKTGWTAIVNGREAENELIVDGNTLKLKWRIPPTIDVDIDDITIESTSDWNGGMVKIDVSSLTKGDYTGEDEITYRLKFGDKTVEGLVENNVATFTLDEYFTAGNIYRGIFELGYGDAGDTIEAAEVIIYEGKLTYADKEGLWVNETPTTLGLTGTYKPDAGVSVDGDVIKIDTQDKVTFSPTLDPDYVDKCDSELTMTIFASEAVDDDLTVEEGAQAGVMIISDGSNGVAFYFIDGGNEAWVKGPAADLNTDYEVTISFHYAKDADDSDSVTYKIDVFEDSYTYAHRPNTADKVTEIVFADGTRFKSLIGTCQIEVADPVAQGIKPGEKQEIVADNDTEAQEKASKIPVMIPEDDTDVVAALNTDAKKEIYKALFKVVAVKKNGSYTAEVVFGDGAISTIKNDEKDILTKVVEAFGSLLGEEGTLDNIKGQPGLYYGIASDGSLVNMGEAKPEEWKIAGADGNIVGLKVKKTASAKQGFYKVICTPTRPATK